MNLERLNIIIDSYIDKFDILTNEEHDENMKWRAIFHFKEKFDINAHNFHNMFKKAMSESSVIINNGTTQPLNGILKLIEHEEDTMRSLFIMLYEDDNGDLDKRQEKIMHFLEETNKLLEKYERGKWKYRQEFRNVLAYLTFYKPEENYLYKPSQCQPFFRYLEYGEELGNGQYFKLSRYYRMCNELKNALLQHQKLIEIHNTRWNKTKDPQDDLHILTFDIIYCSEVYKFYDYDNYKKIIRKNKLDSKQEKYEVEIDKINKDIEELSLELSKARVKLDKIPEINLVGQVVLHKKLGKGNVVKQRGSQIEVEFATKTSNYIYSTAFTSGLLFIEDMSIIEDCKQLEEILSLCKNLEKQIQNKQYELNMLLPQIN